MHGRRHLFTSSPLLIVLWSLAMACPNSLASCLVQWWDLFSPGLTQPPGGGGTHPSTVPSGGLLYGSSVTIESPPVLDLARTNRNTGASLPVEDGWLFEPLINGRQRHSYNGRGTVLMEGLNLSQIGRAITLAVRFWAAGGQVQGAPAGPVAKPQQLVGLAGQYQVTPNQEAGLSLVCPDPTAGGGGPALKVRQWNAASGTATETTIPGATVPGGSANPYLLVGVIERHAPGPTGIRCTAYVNGAATGTPLAGLAAGDIALTRLTFGDMVESDGSFTQGAIWKRRLEAQEIADLGDNLDCLIGLPPLGGGGPGSADPLLTECGDTAIHPEWVVPRRDLAGVLATTGPQRHARRTHELNPRVYELAIRLGSGHEVELIRQALEVTRGGVLPTRWRHPRDDPGGPPSTAPRWHIVNAEEWNVERPKGGHIGSMRLILQEVV